MPDLINPAHNDGKKEFRIWADELCKSCKAQDNCPLFQVLHRHTILTMSGIHVCGCELYDPDVESKYYLPPEPSMDEVTQVNRETLEQRVEMLLSKMETLGEVFVPR